MEEKGRKEEKERLSKRGAFVIINNNTSYSDVSITTSHGRLNIRDIYLRQQFLNGRGVAPREGTSNLQGKIS